MVSGLGSSFGQSREKGKEHVMSLIAKDKMSTSFKKIGDGATSLGKNFFGLGRVVLGLVTSMLLLKTAFGLAAAFMIGLPTIQAGARLRDYNRMMRRAEVSLVLFGLTHERAKELLDAFTGAIDRSTAVSILSNAEAVGSLALLNEDYAIQLAKVSQEISKLTDLDPGQVFQALAAVVTQNDISQLEAMFGTTGRFSEAMAVLKDVDDHGFHNIEGFLKVWEQVSKDMNPENIDILADRLGLLSRNVSPFQEKAAEVSAGAIVTVLDSVIVRLRTLANNGRWVLIGAFIARELSKGLSNNILGANILSSLNALLGSRGWSGQLNRVIRRSLTGGLVGRTVAGIGGGLAITMILDFHRTIGTLINDPKLIFPLAALGFTLGSFLGGRMGAGLIASLAFFLIPGLSTVFKDITLENSILVAVAAAGFFLGRKFIGGKGLGGVMNGIFAALTVVSIGKMVGDFITNDPRSTVSWMSLGFVAGGIIIGAMFGGPFGALMGAQIGLAVDNAIRDLNLGDKTILGLKVVPEDNEEALEQWRILGDKANSAFGEGFTSGQLLPEGWEDAIFPGSNEEAINQWKVLGQTLKDNLLGPLDTLFTDESRWPKQLASSISGGVKAAFNFFSGDESIKGKIVGTFFDVLGTVTNPIGILWKGLLKGLDWVLDQTGWDEKIAGGFAVVFGYAKGKIETLWGWMMNGLDWLLGEDDTDTWVDKVVGFFQGVFEKAKGFVITLWEAFMGLFDDSKMPSPTAQPQPIPGGGIGGFIPDWIKDNLWPEFHSGGIVGGRRGFPTPVMAMGGERFIAPGGDNRSREGDIIIPVSIGGSKLGEIIVDTVRREAKYKGQLNSGNVTAR